jgi:flagellar biosynthesis protein FlhB
LRRVQPCPHTDWVLGLRGVRIRVRRVLPSLFLAPATIKKRKQSNPSKLTTHPIQSHPSTQREKQGKKPSSREMKHLFACFVAVLITYMSFASGERDLRGGVLSMLQTHIVVSSLISRLVLILVFRLAITLMPCLVLLLMLCLSSLMELTIAHMVLVHERIALCLDALDMAHVLIMVIIFRVGMVSLLEGLTLTLSRDIWMAHIFPIVVHVPLSQMVSWKGL